MFDKDFYDKMMEIHSDMKYMREWSSSHDLKDDNRFEETNKKVDWVTRVAYMGLGGLAVLNLIFHLIK